MRSAIFALLLASWVHGQQVNFQGTVLDAVSHRPMAGVHLILRSPDPFEAMGADIYGAVSTDEGRFSFRAAAGEYRLEAKCNGYLWLPARKSAGSDASTITLKPGEELLNFSIEMTPYAVITGHVFDENGDPVPGVPVRAQHYSGYGPVQASTDDHGQYRLPLAPGMYQIMAIAPETVMATTPETHSGNTIPRTHWNTFYPSAISEYSAASLELGPGQHADNIDIHLQPFVNVTISGIVNGLPKDASKYPRVFIVTLEPVRAGGQFDTFPTSDRVTVGPDGAFKIQGTPGRYQLSARAADDEFRSEPIEVLAQIGDLTNLSLTLVHGETLTGTVHVEGEGAQFVGPKNLTVTLEPISGLGVYVRSAVGADGAFHLDHVFHGKFNVRVTDLPENDYLKSVNAGATQSPEGMLDLSEGVSGVPVSIVISHNGGRIEGSLLNKDGQPSNLRYPTVALIRSDAIGSANAKLEKREPQPGTKFAFAGLRPGKYRIIAIDESQLGPEYDTGELPDWLFSKAPEIEVHENDRISRDLKIVDLRANDAK